MYFNVFVAWKILSMHTSVEFGIIDPIFTTPMRDFAPINFVHLFMCIQGSTLVIFTRTIFGPLPPPPSFNLVHGSHMSHGWSHHLSP